jgi:hypothetical protein
MPATKICHRTAGEGPGHTARVYVPEESHSGIVPMNHSNKDGTSLAESEEGRLLIKENTLSSGTFPTQSGCVRASRANRAKTLLSTRSCWHRDPLIVVGTIRLIGSNANTVFSQAASSIQ